MSDLASIEAASIIQFVTRASLDGHLSGRVLDYGCGRQPYREIVEAGGGEYLPFDRKHFGGNVSREDVGEEPWSGIGAYSVVYDAILCTQVIQYVDYPADLLRAFKLRGKVLVMTYPTHWPELRDDRWRFTKLGMERLLTAAGFSILQHVERATVHDPWYETRPGARSTLRAELVIGYGVIAKA